MCVATDFYPDHVSVVWQVSGVKNGTEGQVATDNHAQKKDGLYSITSRLRVRYKDWHNTDKRFTCTVNFFNGKETIGYSDYIYGVKDNSTKGNTMTKEKYLMTANAAKLSYGVFIIKSCVYGVFVAFLVWKLKSSAGKQNN